MKIFITKILLLLFILKLTSSIRINQSLLIEKYGYDIDSIEIDLSESSIESIDINTFKGYGKLEKLFLEDNKINRLENGLFNHLLNLNELWLESNIITSVDENLFVGLNNLEKVCFSKNPISFLFPSKVKLLCNTNPKCKILINECEKDSPGNYFFILKFISKI
jgi:hypothetical protein